MLDPASDSIHEVTNQWADLIRKYNVVYFSAYTIMIQMFAAHVSEPMPSVGCITLAGSPPVKEIVEKSQPLFPKCYFQHRYGLAEIGNAGFSHFINRAGGPFKKNAFTSVGKAGGCDVRIVPDQECEDDGDFPSGEILLRCQSGTQAKGYWRNEAATAASLDEEGYFRTGDLGYLDADGYLYILGRSDDMVKHMVEGRRVPAEKTFPKKIEDVLLRHPGILEAAMIGKLRANNVGDGVVACIVASLPLTEAEIMEHARASESLLQWEVPEKIYFVDELPQTRTGKLARKKLKQTVATWSW